MAILNKSNYYDQQQNGKAYMRARSLAGFANEDAKTGGRVDEEMRNTLSMALLQYDVGIVRFANINFASVRGKYTEKKATKLGDGMTANECFEDGVWAFVSLRFIRV